LNIDPLAIFQGERLEWLHDRRSLEKDVLGGRMLHAVF